MTITAHGRAAQLRADAATYLREAERLDREAAAEKALARELRRPVMPGGRDEQGAAYLVFERTFAGQTYSYAAVIWGTGDGARVMHTGRTTDRRRVAYTWDDFLLFVGENNWHTLRLVVGTSPLGTKSGAQVNDLGALAADVDSCPENMEPHLGKAGPATPFDSASGWERGQRW
jgi:hypothetical protein